MELAQLNASAKNKMISGKYPAAIADFTKVIEATKATTDDKTALKISAYNNRSYCNILIKKYDEALDDINNAIEIANSARKPEAIKALDVEQRKNDEIVPLLVEALARRANIYDMKDKCLESLQEYQNAMNIIPDGDAKVAYNRLLRTCGIHPLPEDQRLGIFSDVVSHILDRPSLVESMKKLCDYFTNPQEISKPDLEFFASSKAINVPDGVITFYVRDPEVVLLSIKTLSAIGKKGCLPVYSFFNDVKDCINNYPKNIEIVTEAVQYLFDTPEQAFIKFADEESIEPICDCFSLGLPEPVKEQLFFILFNIANNEELCLKVLNHPPVLDNIINEKSVGAGMLMSRLTQSTPFAKFAIGKCGFSWIAKLLNPELGVEKVTGLIIALSRCVMICKEVENFDYKSEVFVVVENVVPTLQKMMKSLDICSNGFACLALSVDIVPEKIQQLRAVRLASLGLALHKQHPKVVQNVMAFIYYAAKSGLLQDVKEIENEIVPVIFDAIRESSSYQTICEHSIAILVMLDHPSKQKMLLAGIQQYPNSQIFKELIPGNIDLKQIPH
ncbi:hypothetical protein TVAG_127050 [Trichomonas vaginalis G3]|uniref:TPR Domain containing protein n=1 Tax=Trichomonas vaginalis (strain ATCC PRA-98 / G3) TaxID=412133 RepID=A2E7X3_TRIV3|nr:tetratricopeptide repeat domain domain-containing protein [Trichomonas vaginalis G3]EAY11199.1 hypothetical protein TVAG_127050 [Trichomonas vaginalis G3]KAI5551426.1 tetratricopeptide repeat domain domain-containing protein [Trichomonas vaginalis G3]|eukprot:XP_001323422.1 hypothetical protein [Trichomonas vaginalis G3]